MPLRRQRRGADKEQAKGEKKEATIDEQWAAIKKGYTINFKHSTDATKIIDRKVTKVEDGKIYVLDADNNPKEITRDRFTGLGTISLGLMMADKAAKNRKRRCLILYLLNIKKPSLDSVFLCS